MNYKRILLGGLVSGLIMNIGEAILHAAVLGNQTAQLYRTLQVPPPTEAANMNILVLVTMTFFLGIIAVWLYAAIRPRFGGGTRVALFVGIVVWILAHLWSGIYLAAGYSGIIPAGLAWIPIVWGLFEAPLATLAGAALYKEH